VSDKPDQTRGVRSSGPPAFTPNEKPTRTPIPKRPGSTPVTGEVVVAATPAAISPRGQGPQLTSETTDDEAQPEAIRESIAHTRAEMSSTIDAIQERLDPERLIGEAKETATTAVQGVVQETTGVVREATIGKAEHMMSDASDTARGAGVRFMDTLRDNPLPAALAAIGIGWLFMSARSRDSAAQRARTYQPSYSPAPYAAPQANTGAGNPIGQTVAKAQDKVGDLAGQAKDTAGQVTSGAKDVVSGAAETAGEVVSSTSSKATGAGGSMLETLQNNPIPAAMVGAGIVWLIQSRSTASGRSGSYPPASSSPLDALSGARDSAASVVSQAGEQAGALGDRAQTQVSQAGGQIQRIWNDTPLAVGAAALGLGVAVGLAAPATRQENQLMGEARDRLLDSAQSVAQDTQQKVQRVAQQAQTAAQEEAQRQNLTTQPSA